MKYSNWPLKIKYDDVMDWYEVAKSYLGEGTLCDILVRFISTEDLKVILEDTLSRCNRKKLEDFFELYTKSKDHFFDLYDD